jgi:hypothetical protein
LAQSGQVFGADTANGDVIAGTAVRVLVDLHTGQSLQGTGNAIVRKISQLLRRANA